MKDLPKGITFLAIGLCSFGGLTGSAIAQTTDGNAVETSVAVVRDRFEALKIIPSRYNPDDFGGAITDQNIVTDTVAPETSLFSPTTPSLWWSRDQMPTCWNSTVPSEDDIETRPLLLNQCWRRDNTSLRIDNYRLIRGWRAFHHPADMETGKQTSELNTDPTSFAENVLDFQVDPQYWNRLNEFQQYAVLTQLGTSGMGYGLQVRIYSGIRLVGIHACDFQPVPPNELTTQFQLEPPLENLTDIACYAEVNFSTRPPEPIDPDLFAPP